MVEEPGMSRRYKLPYPTKPLIFSRCSNVTTLRPPLVGASPYRYMRGLTCPQLSWSYKRRKLVALLWRVFLYFVKRTPHPHLCAGTTVSPPTKTVWILPPLRKRCRRMECTVFDDNRFKSRDPTLSPFLPSQKQKQFFGPKVHLDRQTVPAVAISLQPCCHRNCGPFITLGCI